MSKASASTRQLGTGKSTTSLTGGDGKGDVDTSPSRATKETMKEMERKNTGRSLASGSPAASAAITSPSVAARFDETTNRENWIVFDKSFDALIKNMYTHFLENCKIEDPEIRGMI